MSGITLAVFLLVLVLLFFFVRFVQLAWFFVVGIVMILTVQPVVFKLIGAGFLALSIAETYEKIRKSHCRSCRRMFAMKPAKGASAVDFDILKCKHCGDVIAYPKPEPYKGGAGGGGGGGGCGGGGC